MSLRSDLKEKSFIYTAELNPPKSNECQTLLKNAQQIESLVSAINITDNSGATVKLSALAASILIQQKIAVETIWQVTCRDRNRLALQSDFLGASALGIKNILPLRGDALEKGDYPEAAAKSFDLSSTEELFNIIYKLKAGVDLAGKALKPFDSIDMCVGSAAHPADMNLKQQKEKMLRRIDLGVEYYQTQICFDHQELMAFKESIGDELAAKTLVGLTPLKTLGQANFIDKNIWGVNVPESFLNELSECIDANKDSKDEANLKAQHEVGLKQAQVVVKQCKELGFKGVHVMAIGQESLLNPILTQLQ
jgi:5,10-methylenetetrahydrofolate reductase